MNNNQAFVARIKNIEAIPTADNIVKANIVLNGISVAQVVISKDMKEDTLVVYFDANLVISEKYLEKYPKDADYLNKNNHRVRVVSLKKTISNGMAVEVSKFYSFFKDEKEAMKTLIEGFSFNDLNEIPICKKYLPPVNSNVQSEKGNKRNKKLKKFKKYIDGQFSFHVDTLQLLRNLHMLEPNQVISISDKIHGSSFICANSLVKRKLNKFEEVLKFLGVKINDTQYEDIAASRATIKTDNTNGGFYKVDVWTKVMDDFFKGKLFNGETIYGEVYGYVPGTSSCIQKSGKYIWNYGCKEGEYKIVVYRITKTAPDGTILEYSWNDIKERCLSLAVPMVEEFFYGRARDLFPEIDVDEEWKFNFVKQLEKVFLNKIRTDCIGAPNDEGIVLRIEGGNIKVFKLKDEKFLLQSRAGEDKGEIVDIEETEQAENM